MIIVSLPSLLAIVLLVEVPIVVVVVISATSEAKARVSRYGFMTIDRKVIFL
jgi:hypothetical protein